MKNCLICSVEIPEHKKYCSRKCSEEFTKWYNNNFYWRNIRNSILKRDNYTCQICGLKLYKRKRQNKVGSTFDPTKPVTANSIDLGKLGTEDDCFGQIHDPTDTECKMCGDAGLCLIVQGQLNRKKRLSEESKSEFRDLKIKNKLPAKKTTKKKKK